MISNKSKKKLLKYSDVSCCCNRNTYSHYMDSGCVDLLKQKLKEWKKSKKTNYGTRYIPQITKTMRGNSIE